MSQPNSTPLPTEALAELRALLAKATPGPWKAHPADAGYGATVSKDGGSIAAVWPSDLFGKAHDADANAALIVFAVNQLPALLDKIDTAAEQVASLRRAINDALHCTPHVQLDPGDCEHRIVYDCGDPWEILRSALGAAP